MGFAEMGFGTSRLPDILSERSQRRWWRQITVAAACLALVACSDDISLFEKKTAKGTIGHVAGFLGGVAADEPRAALVGRDVLSAGGSAADAATAIYFALAVTLPSSASLAGGGSCVVYDNQTKTAEALEFLPRPPARVPSGASRPSAVPGNVRGFFILHSKYGILKWSEIVAPAENLARFGHPVSRAFAARIKGVGDALFRDAGLKKVFATEEGKPVGENDVLTQTDLSTVLGRIRARGAGDFYTGPFARQVVEAFNGAGGSLTAADLRDYRPRWMKPIEVPFVQNLKFAFAPPPAAAGAVSAQMMAMLLENGFKGAKGDAGKHLLAETARRAFADRGAWMGPDGALNGAAGAVALVAEERMARLMASFDPTKATPSASLNPPPRRRPETPAATSFVVMDNGGDAVACTVTMNNLFGTGRMARGLGIILAAAPDQRGRTSTPVGPMVIMNRLHGELFMAAAASGGVVAPTALATVVGRTMIGEEKLTTAMNAPRVHHGGDPDVLYYEKTLDAAEVSALQARGHEVAPVAALGLVNVTYCAGGMPGNAEFCTTQTDPRGFGLAVTAD